MMLFSWTCDCPPTNLSESTCEYFVKCLDELVGDKDTIIVNCNDINDIDDHSVDPIFKFIKERKKAIIFFADDNKKQLVDHLDGISRNYDIEKNFFTEKNIKSIFFDNGILSRLDAVSWIKEALNLEKKWLIRQVKKSFQPYDTEKRLSSTPLKASGEFNATKILSHPAKFKWVVTIMAESINRIIQIDQPKSLTIISASLRGAVIAGGVWEILYYVCRPNLHLVDHMGPRYDILEIPSKKDKSIAKYCIYIGDFMIAGTETKVVSSYCSLFGGNLKHAFVIGKYIDETYLSNDIQLHALVNLKECVADLQYVLD